MTQQPSPDEPGAATAAPAEASTAAEANKQDPTRDVEPEIRVTHIVDW